MAFKVKRLEGDFGIILEEIGSIYGEKLLEEYEEDYRLYGTTSCYHIPELNINIHCGDIYVYDEDTKDFELSDNIYLVFNAETKNFVYSEQGGSLETTIHNYCTLVLKNKNINMAKVEDMDCVYKLDNGDILDSYKSVNYF